MDEIAKMIEALNMANKWNEDNPDGAVADVAQVVVSGPVPGDWVEIRCDGCEKTGHVPPDVAEQIEGTFALCRACAAGVV